MKDDVSPRFVPTSSASPRPKLAPMNKAGVSFQPKAANPVGEHRKQLEIRCVGSKFADNSAQYRRTTACPAAFSTSLLATRQLTTA